MGKSGQEAAFALQEPVSHTKELCLRSNSLDFGLRWGFPALFFFSKVTEFLLQKKSSSDSQYIKQLSALIHLWMGGSKVFPSYALTPSLALREDLLAPLRLHEAV